MSVGTSTALIIGAGIAAGSQIASSHNASSAATNAAKTQADSAAKAQQVASDQFAQAKAAEQPYLQAGANAAGTLGGLMGPSAGRPAYVRPVQPPPMSNGMSGGPGPNVGAPVATGMATGPGPAGSNVSMGSIAPTPQPMVTLRGPDGSVQSVPASQAGHYVSLGATVVPSVQPQPQTMGAMIPRGGLSA